MKHSDTRHIVADTSCRMKPVGEVVMKSHTVDMSGFRKLSL